MRNLGNNSSLVDSAGGEFQLQAAKLNCANRSRDPGMISDQCQSFETHSALPYGKVPLAKQKKAQKALYASLFCWYLSSWGGFCVLQGQTKTKPPIWGGSIDRLRVGTGPPKGLTSSETQQCSGRLWRTSTCQAREWHASFTHVSQPKFNPSFSCCDPTPLGWSHATCQYHLQQATCNIQKHDKPKTLNIGNQFFISFFKF